MSKILLYFLLLATKILYISLQSCNYVSDTLVEFRVLDNLTARFWNKTVVSDCISDASFDIPNIAHIDIGCRIGSVSVLEKNFISNMSTLKRIYIENCHIRKIEPGAFSNLPQLEKVSIINNPFESISRGVFSILPSLRSIEILRNKLSYIEDDSFANLPNLYEIALAGNNLDHIKREWFTNTSNIVYFTVFKNSIRKIPLGMFHGWKRLKDISLNSNAVSVIEGELFKNNRPIILHVRLHHNRLTSLHPNTFPDSVFIHRLTISGNLLNFFPQELLKNIRVAQIDIFGNPFSCPCLENIQKRFLDRGVSIDNPDDQIIEVCKDGNVPVCGYSTNSSRICSESVDKELTQRMISYFKKIGYDKVRDTYEQECTVFDNIN